MREPSRKFLAVAISSAILTGLTVIAVALSQSMPSPTPQQKGEPANSLEVKPMPVKGATTAPRNQQTAIFAAGCFWGVENRFRREPGVYATAVGYIGGVTDNPTYKQVCTGTTGHAEGVLVIYDADKTDYATLLQVFFEAHDPTTLNRQGPDVGTQYRSAVFFQNPEQRRLAVAAIQQANDSGKFRSPVVTTLEPAGQFWFAELYHQQYNEKRGIDSCGL
ncbi:MAG: peptide-methionine (S)-S-oxide reductase MsrA [Fimbriimonadaceae bacterium]